MYIIHVGKSGGENLLLKLKKYYNIPINSIHVHQSRILREEILLKDKELILLLRDPCKRFVSIFNFWKYLHIRKYSNNDKLSHENLISLNKKCFLKYETANQLANDLSNENKEIREFAEKCMHDMHHIDMGLSHYLLSPDFLEKIRNNIKFIVRLEHYENDVKILNDYILNKYNINDDKYNNIIEKNEVYNTTNSFDKNLSNDAIKNLKTYFKKDYLIVDKLKELNFITDEYVNSFL